SDFSQLQIYVGQGGQKGMQGTDGYGSGGWGRADGGDGSATISGASDAGGGGALKQLDNEDVYELLLKFNKEEKIIGAICISPVILANAGLLEGKQSTVWSSNMDKKPVKMIEEKGAVYCDEGVVVDGRIVTADGPRTAADFGKELVLNIKKTNLRRTI
ncbi:MAG: DJ-1/PfpI family protein, partial [Patescibacteria group bacterium]